jgi:MoaA/NifB/PqqE/SkfB family radical SAM enzyme
MKNKFDEITCIAPFQSVYVDIEGRVSSCCYEWLHKTNGSLQEKSLQEIIEGPESVEIRKSMRGTDFKFCSKTLCPGLSIYQSSGKTTGWLRPEKETRTTPTEVLAPEYDVELFLNYDDSCNLACPSCRNELILYKRGEAPTKLEIIHSRVMEGVEYLLNSGYRVNLNITGSGDPFASPFFWDMIREEKYFDRVGLKIQTNGVLMTPARIEHKNILENTNHLQISVDAFLEETYNKVRVNGNFEVLRKNLRHLDSLISQKKFKYLKAFRLNFVVQEKNYREIVDFAKWALSFENLDAVWFNIISDWRHFPPGAYDAAAIWKSEHPGHHDFLCSLMDPVLDHPQMDLGNLAPFVKKAKELRHEDFTKNSSFCVAPWIHHNRTPSGRIGLCCLSDPLDDSLKNKTYEEIHNSPEMKKIRLQMMSGELPKECHACKNPNTNTVYKDSLNREFLDLHEKIKEQTSPDGHTTMTPSFLDFRFLDCNLACRTCSPDYSSRIYREFEKKGDSPALIETIGYDDVYREFARKEYHRLIEDYEWRRIYFAGGEPLLQKDHLKILETLAAKPEAKSLDIFYNTNLSFGQNYIARVLELLSKFGKVGLHVSIDSYGKFNDMVRNGSKFSQIESNISYVNQHKSSNLVLIVDLTITSVFFFNAIEYSEWIIRNKYFLNARVMNGFGYHAFFLRLEFLKLSFREKIFRQWSAWYRTQSPEDQELLVNLKEVLTNFYNLPELSSPEISDETLKEKTSLLDPDTLNFVKHTMSEYFVLPLK